MSGMATIGIELMQLAFVAGIFMRLGGFNVDIKEIKRRLRQLEAHVFGWDSAR